MLSSEERRLISILSQNCRQTAEELSVQTGLSAEYIKDKIQEWENRQILIKYKPVINWEELDEERVTAFIEVKVSTQRNQGFDHIAARLKKFPDIKAVYLVSGDHDFCLVMEGRNMYEISQFVSDKLSPLEAVEQTNTRFVLRRYKEDGVQFHGEEEGPRRLVITP